MNRIVPIAEIDGFIAGYAGRGFLDNPHQPDSICGRRWIDGLVAGMRDKREELSQEQNQSAPSTESVNPSANQSALLSGQ